MRIPIDGGSGMPLSVSPPTDCGGVDRAPAEPAALFISCCNKNGGIEFGPNMDARDAKGELSRFTGGAALGEQRSEEAFNDDVD